MLLVHDHCVFIPTDKKPEDDPTVIIVVLVVAVLVLAITVVALVVYICFKRKRAPKTLTVDPDQKNTLKSHTPSSFSDSITKRKVDTCVYNYVQLTHIHAGILTQIS